MVENKNMNWFFWSLLSALSLATADFITKKYLKFLSPWEMSTVRIIYALPFLLPFLFFLSWPLLNKKFWLTLLFLYPLEILALFLYMAAIKISPLSLTLPFLSFTPIFLILTGWFILKEMPNFVGIMGILAIAIGSYLLYLPPQFFNLKESFRLFWEEKGSFLMLLVSAIYAITSALGKKAILYSNALFFGPFYYIGLSLFFLPFFFKRRIFKKKTILIPSCMIGFFTALMIVSHVIAISQIKAVYMISIKRLAPLFGVIYGGIFLKEEKFFLRFLATGLMCLGAIIIYIWG
ncbi:MAG TPA: DMT family transporter [Candidatus Desulfofervidus auxilii]|uniref:DMT family transporter n=1 Tax=Desulfofervidus auxilii TaxID=1621989 RepID=A0A7C0Y1X0_DESA2|nr:DMT family transporter [Candidatus Desulfofervidus auxilii]